jgi:peroxiredoxin
MAAIKLHEPAKPFSLVGVDGQKHALADYSNKEAVVVIFSCNHCPSVKAWEDRMGQIQADYGPKGTQLLVINANDARAFLADSFPKMQERAAEKGFHFPYLHDPTQEVARAYGAERTPEVFVFDRQGVLRSALDAVLAGQTPQTAQTQPVGCTIK